MSDSFIIYISISLSIYIYMCVHIYIYIYIYLSTSFRVLPFKFTYLGNSVSSTETDINTWLAKGWTVINRHSVIWKSDLTDKMKRSFFQAAIMSILLYGCTTWTLNKWMEKKLDGNYTRMLRTCPWWNGYRRRKWTRRHEFKSWTRLIAFHIALIPLGKVWIQ